MFKSDLITILVVIAASTCQIIEATTAFYKVSLFINPTSTTTIYFSVDAVVVTGVFDSITDLNANINNVIPVGGYASNDNKFVYHVVSPFDITTGGIGFNNAGASFSLSLDTTISPSALSLSSSLGFFATNIIATVTLFPIQYYILTVSTIPVRLHYIAVVSKRVIGVYLSVTDALAETSNLLIAQGSAFSNDNQFDYSVGAPSYDISESGIGFYLSSNNGCVLYYVASTSPPSFRVVSTLNPYGAVTATVTPLLPTAYYILTINTNPSITLYLAAIFTNIVGVYDTLADTNWPTLNRILPVGDLYGNDNILNYTSGAPFYGITDWGISFISAGGVSINLFYPHGLTTLYLGSDFGPYGPTTATVTPITIPISYYTLTISSTPPRVFYITVATAQVRGVYASLDNMNALSNNLILEPQTYKDNDNNFDYTASAPYYGLTHSGVSFLLDGNDANLYLLPLMYPSLFLYFDYGGLVYNIPVTVTVESLAPTSIPTTTPTRAPTRTPTHQPTHQPSHTPSKHPSKRPTRKPTHTPTHKPTHTPTHKPTHTPTHAPSRQPTHTPTMVPTV